MATPPTIRVLDGLNAGDYVIQSFDAVLGGTGPVVDRAAAATGFGQRYEVFTVSDGLEFPLVRIRELEVLDSTNQGTGITVPYGDAVDIRPQCAFEGAGKSIRVLDKQLIIVPDGSSLIPAEDTIVTPGATTDARYSTEVAVQMELSASEHRESAPSRKRRSISLRLRITDGWIPSWR